MPKVNIPSYVCDFSYRYKRDRIEITIQNTNGGMTKLLNIDKIALQLGSIQEELLKFLKKKANTSIIEKNGIFLRKIESVDNIEKIIEEFIIKYVLCQQCSNPEFIAEKVNNTEVKTCKACGYSRTNNT